MISRRFKQAGYSTAYIGKWHLSSKEYPRRIPPPDFLKQDFDFRYRTQNHTHFKLRYDDNGTMKDYGQGWQPGHEVDKTIEYIQTVDNQSPFFAILSMGPPHNGSYPGFGEARYTPGAYSHRKDKYGDYAPPEFEKPYLNLTEKEIRQNILPVKINYGGKERPADPESDYESALGAVPGYFGACSAKDADLGRLFSDLDASGLAENTIMVFTSDHGGMLGSHGFMTKGVCFEESIHIPLILHVPGRQGAEHSRVFNRTDVMPTLLGLCGIPLPSGLDGFNHASFLQGDPAAREPEMAFIGLYEGRGWRTKRYTYVSSASETFGGREANYLQRFHQKQAGHMLFDLHNDPYQNHPIFKGDSKATDALIDDFHDQLVVEVKKQGHSIPEKV